MKERPILFSAPMVRALLAGNKTQTRRMYKIRKHSDFGCEIGASELCREAKHVIDRMCPYGQPGDQLWVKETYQGPLVDDFESYLENPHEFQTPEFCEYAADGGPKPEFVTLDDELVCRWRPSIFMHRWASRIQLEITSVRVERLQDCSEADAKAEGAQLMHLDNLGNTWKTYKRGYESLWESINGSGSWDANPWVWVVEFKVIKP